MTERDTHLERPAFDQAPLEGSDAEAYAALKAKRAARRRKKLIRRSIMGGGAVAVLIVGGLIFGALSRQPEQQMEPVTDFVTQGTFTTVVDAKGTLQPPSSTVITPEVTGQIESVNVVAGQFVNQGDVLMTIRNPELDRAVEQAERGLRQAKSDLASAQKALSSTAAQPVDAPDGSMGGDIEGARSAVNNAQVAVESAQAAYDDAVAKAALRTVKAPSSGSIVALNAQVGADLNESLGGTGANGPLMQIADLSKMKVSIQVSEEDIARVAVDQSATITCPAFPDLSLTGRVTSIASIASSGGAMTSYDGSSAPTFTVDILIDAPDDRLKPGMTADVSLTTQKLDNVVMVPTMALLTDDGETYYVNLETDETTHEFKRVDVTVFAQNDEQAVIGRPEDAPEGENADMETSPLSDGDVLVVAGGQTTSESEAGGGSADGGMAVL